MLEDKFSVQNKRELYYKDIFIGYFLEDIYTDIFVKTLNYEDSFVLDKKLEAIEENNCFILGDKVWLEIKNGNFNKGILAKLNLQPDYKKVHTHYSIKVNEGIYLDFLTKDFREAVLKLISERLNYKNNFPNMSESFTLNYKIQPLNLPYNYN